MIVCDGEYGGVSVCKMVCDGLCVYHGVCVYVCTLTVVLTVFSELINNK